MPDEVAATDTSAAASVPVVDAGAVAAPAGEAASGGASPQAGQVEGAAASGQGAGEGAATNGGAAAETNATAGTDTLAGAAETPITYEPFKLPEGMTIPDALRDGIVAIASAHKMNQDQAQALTDLGVQQSQFLHEHFASQAMATPVLAAEHWASTWSQQTASDPVLGGDKLAQSVGLASRVFKTFGDDALGTFLNDTGLAHHPGLIRMFHAIGKAVSEDTLVAPQGSSKGPGIDTAKKLYPNMN